MLENTVRWRRDYRPDEIDPDYIKPEVSKKKRSYDKEPLLISGYTFLRLRQVKCTLMDLIIMVDQFGLCARDSKIPKTENAKSSTLSFV